MKEVALRLHDLRREGQTQESVPPQLTFPKLKQFVLLAHRPSFIGEGTQVVNQQVQAVDRVLATFRELG